MLVETWQRRGLLIDDGALALKLLIHPLPQGRRGAREEFKQLGYPAFLHPPSSFLHRQKDMLDSNLESITLKLSYLKKKKNHLVEKNGINSRKLDWFEYNLLSE